MGVAVIAETFFWLLCGHAVADFALQSDAMAKGKNRHRKTEPPPGAKYQPTWYFWLTAHSLVHAAAVALVLDWRFGVAEFVAHWIIDFGKCENWYGVNADQTFHVALKLGWVLV